MLAKAQAVLSTVRMHTAVTGNLWLNSLQGQNCVGTVKLWKMLQSNMNSKANGALMRITPLAVWGHQLSEGQLAQAAREDAKLTHPNQTCQVGVGTQPRQLPVHICKSIINFLSFRCSPRSGTLMLTAACRLPKPIISQSCAYLYLSNPCMVDAQQSP